VLSQFHSLSRFPIPSLTYPRFAILSRRVDEKDALHPCPTISRPIKKIESNDTDVTNSYQSQRPSDAKPFKYSAQMPPPFKSESVACTHDRSGREHAKSGMAPTNQGRNCQNAIPEKNHEFFLGSVNVWQSDENQFQLSQKWACL
jgi:hypothetical protein